MTELAGQSLGQYKIIKEIAKGGMATVYLARQASMGRDVAIKLLPSTFTHEESFLERFYREVEIIAKLQHPHILPVYDFGEYDGLPYIVMAYLSGGTLADSINAGNMTPREIGKTIRQIGDALDFAHSKGILHRDFKPANVLLDEQGNTYLADFGLAKIAESASDITGAAILGTPAYMAPEQAGPDEITSSIDVYAFGVTIYQMLAGEVPYQAPSAAGVLMAHITSPVPNILMTSPHLPPAIQAVMERALAKEPDVRYASAGELVHNVIQVLEGSSSSGSDTPVQESRTALLMTNMLGRVIFVDNQCLRILKRKQSDARNIIGKPIHEVLGSNEKTLTHLIEDVGNYGKVDDIHIEIKDSEGNVRTATFSAVATRDDDGKYVGADIALEVITEIGEMNTEEMSSVRKPADTQEENLLEDYFKSQIESLYKLMLNWGGRRVSHNLEDIINETGQRNVWSVSMRDGVVTVQLDRSDIDVYQALLARAMSYASSIIGKKLVLKEMEQVNKKTDPAILEFIQNLGLGEYYSQILV